MNELKWIASILLIIAGIMISFKVPHFEYAFVVFFAGHTIMQFVFLKTKENAMLMANSFFWVIDVVGIYRWLL